MIEIHIEGSRRARPRSARTIYSVAERRPGRWEVAESMSVFGGLAGRGFPVVLSLLHEGRVAVSALPPSRVAQGLATLWDSVA